MFLYLLLSKYLRQMGQKYWNSLASSLSSMFTTNYISYLVTLIYVLHLDVRRGEPGLHPELVLPEYDFLLARGLLLKLLLLELLGLGGVRLLGRLDVVLDVGVFVLATGEDGQELLPHRAWLHSLH